MNDRSFLTGMVLSSMPVGDYDKRITILTKEWGKVSGFVRGARRPRSTMLAASNPFSFGTFEAYHGRDSYTFSKAEISNYFTGITQDLDKVCMGSYFLEVADHFSGENLDEKERLKLLYQSLRALETDKFNPRLVRAVYELKTMVYNGEYPDVYSCISCKGKENLHYIDLTRGGCLCDKCAVLQGGDKLDTTLHYTMQFVISTPPEKLYSFALSDEILEAFVNLMDKLKKHYFHHTFKSEAFLEK